MMKGLKSNLEGIIEAIKKEWSLKSIKSWLVNFWKENRIALIAFTLFISLFYAIDCDLSWLENTKLFEISRNLFIKIGCNSKLNWWIVLASVALAGCIIYRNIRDRDIRPWRALFIVVMMIVLCHSGKLYDFVGLRIKDTYLFDYRTLWLALLSILLIVPPVYKVIARWIESKKLRSNNNGETVVNPGFITDTVNLGQSADDNFKSYAGTIVKRLLGTDLSEKSFAVGITGEWGSGKSTFLNSLRAAFKENGEFKNQAEIVEFNPWMCQSPEQVIADFFNALREQLSPRHSRLSRPIKEYASVLNAIATSTSIDLITKVNSLWPKDKSLQKKKEHLSQQLRKIDKPVVVFIDDLDRLESREVFEVLRLVRNTGDLCNMIYIVAYDKDYLVSVLSENSIQNGSTYLEKIFPVELHLPKIDGSSLFKVFLRCIDKQIDVETLISQESFMRLKLGLYRAGDYYSSLIPKILFNYRRIRNFSRRFVILFDLYLKKSLIDEIDICDLLGIELLEIQDKDTFDRLGRVPESILTRSIKRYAFLQGDKDSFCSKHGNNSTVGVTLDLLALLFGTSYSDDVPLKSIRDSSNFYTYFQFSLPKDILTKTEFNEIFNEGANINEIVLNWAKTKSSNSVIARFNDSTVISPKKQKAYLNGVLSLFEYKSAMLYYEVNDFRKLLAKERFSDNVVEDLKASLLNWFNGMSDFSKKSRLLNALYIIPGKNEHDEYLIDNNDVKKLLRDDMSSFLKNNSNLDIKDVITFVNVDIEGILHGCCVCKEFNKETKEETWENVAFDIISNHFTEMEKKYTRKELNEAVNEMIKKRIASSRIPDSDDITSDNKKLAKYRETILCHRFGSDYEKKLEELIDKCSLKTDEGQINAHAD